MEKVVLVGYMGSGKSVVSLELSKKMELKAVELDELIEKTTSLSIKKIFEKNGELFFRKIENAVFKELIFNEEDLIISTGGGTPCYYNNHELLNGSNCKSIYLKASIDTLYSRLISEKNNRPLLSNLDETEFRDYIAKHLFERSYFYNFATHIINVDNKSIEDIVNEIVLLLA